MQKHGVRIETERLVLLLLNVDEAEALAAFARRNRDHHSPWEPLRGEDYYGVEWWRQNLLDLEEETIAGRAAHFAGYLADGGQLVLRANLSNIIRGVFQAAFLGFAVDQSCEGRGLAFEGVQALVRFAFEELNLHRLMANHRPENKRSAALLDRLGFEREGYAKAYLHINGHWCDHVLMARTNPAWHAPG